MDYVELRITPQPTSAAATDVLAALLAPLGFESFEEREGMLLAYCPVRAFSEPMVAACLSDLPLPGVTCSYVVARVATEDWNALWERDSFAPIVIGDQCVIHAPADAGRVPPCRHDITIEPRMSFGSGHHETTAQLIEVILGLPLARRRVLDMGCGTAVLAIVAARCGAAVVRAIDIDDWACVAARENVALNAVPQVRVDCGDAAALDGDALYDYIFANINRNILLADMPRYVAHLAADGELLLSGFYDADVAALVARAGALGLALRGQRSRGGWAVLRLARRT